jgi:hypothetical protein
MTRLISNSEVQTFKDCKRKWWLAYYRRLQVIEEGVVGAAQTGGRIHRALEPWYVPEGTKRVDPRTTLERVIEADREVLGENVEVELLKKFTTAINLERAMINGYMLWLDDTGEDQHFTVVGSEEYVEALMPGFDDVVIIGKLDVRVRDLRTGRKKFIDHKTVGDLKTPLIKIRGNEQMLHYEFIEFLINDGDDYCDGAVYNMLKKVKGTAKAKPPFFARHLVTHNTHELESFRKRLHHTISDILELTSAIDAGADPVTLAYPHPTRDCSWKCPFVQQCDLFDDGSRVEAALKEHFTEGNPLRYYAHMATQEGTTRDDS